MLLFSTSLLRVALLLFSVFSIKTSVSCKQGTKKVQFCQMSILSYYTRITFAYLDGSLNILKKHVVNPHCLWSFVPLMMLVKEIFFFSSI